jgi:hypothetical protein
VRDGELDQVKAKILCPRIPWLAILTNGPGALLGVAQGATVRRAVTLTNPADMGVAYSVFGPSNRAPHAIVHDDEIAVALRRLYPIILAADEVVAANEAHPLADNAGSSFGREGPESVFLVAGNVCGVSVCQII